MDAKNVERRVVRFAQGWPEIAKDLCFESRQLCFWKSFVAGEGWRVRGCIIRGIFFSFPDSIPLGIPDTLCWAAGKFRNGFTGQERTSFHSFYDYRLAVVQSPGQLVNCLCSAIVWKVKACAASEAAAAGRRMPSRSVVRQKKFDATDHHIHLEKSCAKVYKGKPRARYTNSWHFAHYFTHGLGSTEGANLHYDYKCAYLSTRCVLSWFPGKELEKKIKKSKGKSVRAQSLAQTERFWSCNMDQYGSIGSIWF